MFKELQGSYLLACSGGPDSMALFDMLVKNNINFEVAHVNYHHRDSADRDQQIVKDFAAKHNIKFNVADYVETGGNFQDSARVFRYNFFRNLINSQNLDGVLVAHQLDDVIETYFLQKNRGSTPSCYGLKNIADLNGLKVFRPLLNYSKDELENYCKEFNIPYGIDESNLKDDYKRNEIRHNIVSKLSKNEKETILNEIAELNKNLVLRKNKLKKYLDQEYLPFSEYQKIDDYRMFLRLKIDMGIAGDYLEEIHHQLLTTDNLKIEYNNQIITKEYQNISVFTRNSDYQYILNKDEIINTPYFIFKKQGTNFEAVNLKDDDYPIMIRNYKQGDKIRMRYGIKKVNRFFIDKKIPYKERLSWPVVVNSNGTVIHVPGIGSDIDHFAKEPTFFMVKL